MILEALEGDKQAYGNRMYLRYVKKTKQFRLQITKVQPAWGYWSEEKAGKSREDAVVSFELTKANLEQLMDGLILAKALLEGETKLEDQE